MLLQTSPDLLQLEGAIGVKIGFPVTLPWVLVTEIVQLLVVPCREAVKVHPGREMSAFTSPLSQATPVPPGPVS